MHLAPVQPSPHPPSRRTAALVAAPAALASVVLTVLVAVSWHPLMALDGTLARTAHRWATDHRGLTRAARFLTDWVWDPATMRVLCAGAVVWLLWRHRAMRLALWVAATCALGALVQNALKAAVGRARPVWPDPVDSAYNGAFPSGHAMTATVVSGLLLWLLHRYGVRRAVWRTAVAAAVVSVVGVGLTRVWLGVHWPSDVVGGWLLGALLVALAVASHGRWQEPKERRAPHGSGP
ncbi:phosphatase PAP2 family protein [Streptomyces sp. NPDC047079]|uniref:phosphatase PAP2 family protein n=1 Tax=Streptomyces sp. NPDC047079 TaxID=3154607 RepID=UPI0033E92593